MKRINAGPFFLVSVLLAALAVCLTIKHMIDNWNIGVCQQCGQVETRKRYHDDEGNVLLLCSDCYRMMKLFDAGYRYTKQHDMA